MGTLQLEAMEIAGMVFVAICAAVIIVSAIKFVLGLFNNKKK